MTAAPVSQLTAWVVLPTGETVRCLSAAVTIDEGWSPSVQADVVVPWTRARAALLDPRTAPRLRVGVRRSWTRRATLAELSTTWASTTLAGLSTAWAGATLADLTAAWTTAWESGTRGPDELSCDLTVRAVDADLLADTITIRATSDEVLLQGVRLNATRPAEKLEDRLRALFALAGVSYTSADFGIGGIAVPAATYDVTRTVWEIVADLAAEFSLRLWCDHERRWRLAAPSALTPGTATLTRVIRATDTADLDNGEYADTIVWRGTAEVRQTDGVREWWVPVVETAWYTPPAPTLAPSIVYLWEQDFGRLDVSSIPAEWVPAPATLAARLARQSSRGRVVTIDAPADPRVRTGQPIVTGAPSLPPLSGVVAAVTLNIPEDTMTIRTRSTVDEAA